MNRTIRNVLLVAATIALVICAAMVDGQMGQAFPG
jgi:hypothetical protein